MKKRFATLISVISICAMPLSIQAGEETAANPRYSLECYSFEIPENLIVEEYEYEADEEYAGEYGFYVSTEESYLGRISYYPDDDYGTVLLSDLNGVMDADMEYSSQNGETVTNHAIVTIDECDFVLMSIECEEGPYNYIKGYADGKEFVISLWADENGDELFMQIISSLLVNGETASNADSDSNNQGEDAISYNHDSETVLQVQTLLNAAGYDCGTPDGEAGAATTAAIEKYQSDHGLTADGRITKALLQTLE